MFGFSFQEVFIIGIVALLLFGKRLPEVAKSLGNSYREFRKGLSEIQSSFNYDSHSSSSSTYGSSSNSGSSYDEYDDYAQPTAPKFEPPPSEPQLAGSPDVPSGEIPKPVSETERQD